MDNWQETIIFQQFGTTVVKTTQDCEGIVEANKKSQSDPHRSDWGQPIADIPNTVILQWLYEEHARGNTALKYPSPEFTRLMRRKVNDRDFLFLRTR